MYESAPICRVCLKSLLEYIDLQTPFNTGNYEEIEEASTGYRNSMTDETADKKFTYLDCFELCTRLIVSADESLCVSCALELRIAYEFIQKAQSAAIILEQSRQKTKLQQLDNHCTLGDDLTKFREYEELLGDEIVSSESVEHNDVDSSTEDGVTYTELHSSEIHDIPQTKQEYKTIDESDHESRDVVYVETACGDNVIDAETDQETKETEFRDGDKTSSNPTVTNDITRSIIVENADKGGEDSFQCANSDARSSTKYSVRFRNRTKHRKTALTHYSRKCRKNLCSEHNITNCSQCDFQDKDFKAHEHEQLNPKMEDFLCNICSKTFTTYGILNAHLKYHQRKQANIKSDACTICNKQFSSKHYLRLHMEVHKNNRDLHECNQCDKLYVTKTALENHKKLHKGETIKCVSCDKQFSRQYELNVHMRFHTRDFPFECDVCGKKFAIKGHLRTHMWRHQGLKLQCEDCGKLFTSSKALQEHSFVHSEMPFPCSYCPKAYPSRQKFKVHLKVAHSLELNNEELLKIAPNIPRKTVRRKKLTLVQADSVMKEEEVKTRDAECDDVQEIVIDHFQA